MTRRVSRSQLQSQIRQAQARQRQAINKYNSAIRKANRDIADHNRKARAHNARVRANRARLQRELQRLSRTSTSTVVRYNRYHQSVTTLQKSFGQMESKAEAGAWVGSETLFEMSEGETANSVAVLNALVTETTHVAATEPGLVRNPESAGRGCAGWFPQNGFCPIPTRICGEGSGTSRPRCRAAQC